MFSGLVGSYVWVKFEGLGLLGKVYSFRFCWFRLVGMGLLGSVGCIGFA